MPEPGIASIFVGARTMALALASSIVLPAAGGVAGTVPVATRAAPTTIGLAPVVTEPVPASGHATPSPPAWSLLPQPADARPAPSGSVQIADGASIEVRGADAERIRPIVERFVRLVASTRGLRLTPLSPGAPRAKAADARGGGGQPPSATVETQPAKTELPRASDEAPPAIIFEIDPRASVDEDGGYRLNVGAGAVHVLARSPAGIFYGAVTVWQLLTPPGWVRGTSAEIAAGVIQDHPRLAWRALLLDSGRHYQSVADIERLIDWMSLEKLNVLLWHLTEDQGWRLEISKYPELTSTGACRKAVGLDLELTGASDKAYCGFYTQAQVREIVRHAADRFVTIVPEIDIPGHSQAAVAAYPWLGATGERPAVWTDWGISPWLLKPDEKTLQFVDDVLDEVMQLFPSRYLSIGGDEADKRQWDASPELRERLRQLKLANMDQLQGWFTQRVAAHLVGHGRTPVGWDDELLAGVELPPSQVVMSWHGGKDRHVVLEAAARGHDVVLAPTDSLYFDYYQSNLPDEWTGQPPMTTLRQAYDTPVPPRGASAAQAKHIIGVQGNLWTELAPTFAHVQHALFPRTAALAELGWSAARPHDWNGFLRRLTAELGRYQALGIGYADSAFAPAFDVAAGRGGTLRIALSNQAGFGDIRYTTEGSVPTAASPRYERPLEIPIAAGMELRAATFGPGGFELGAPRSRTLDAATLRTRDSVDLASCSDRAPMRLDGDRPSQGSRPTYRVYVGDMCWVWPRATLGDSDEVALTVGRVAWRYGDDAEAAVVRPKASPAGEFELHVDACDGPLLARMPLASALPGTGQHELRTSLPPPNSGGAHDLCILATGDPREGEWVLARVAFSRAAERTP